MRLLVGHCRFCRNLRPPTSGGLSSDALVKFGAGGRAALARGVSTWVHKIDSFVDTCSTEKDNRATLSGYEYKDAIKQATDTAASRVVPWFMANMSPSYFYTVSKGAQEQHLRTLAALYSIGSDPTITIADGQRDEITIIQPGEGTGLARATAVWAEGGQPMQPTLEILKHVPTDKGLHQMKKYTALDGSLTMIIVNFAEPARFSNVTPEQQNARERALRYAQEIQASATRSTTDFTQQSDHRLNSLFQQSRDKWSLKQAETKYVLEQAAIDDYLAQCPEPYVVHHRNPRRLLEQHLMYRTVVGTDQTEVAVERWDPSEFGQEDEPEWSDSTDRGKSRYFLTIASGNAHPSLQLANLANYLGTKDLSIRRLYLDLINDPDNHDRPVMMLRLFVAQVGKGSRDTPSATEFDLPRSLCDDLRKLKWIDSNAIRLAQDAQISFQHAEIIDGYANCVHGPLMKQNKYAYTMDNIYNMLHNPALLPVAKEIASLFLRRFTPLQGVDDVSSVAHGMEEKLPISDDKFASEVEECQQSIACSGADEDESVLLETMLECVCATERTNFFVPDRYGFGIRLKPEFMGCNADISTEVPFGTFFVRARRMVGFHVRWRDVARGGLRMSVPVSYSDHAVRCAGAYDEAYSLSYAQQLKNKDIPEGGSKAVCVVDLYPYDGVDSEFLTRKSVKAFSDTILTLTSQDDNINRCIVDQSDTRQGSREQIYLGPDENIIPEDIEWMTERATTRSYPCPSAFISSKPSAGFNHKEFGVTSEGVNVFLDEALRQAGFDPEKDTFTVKITGGTDGDVAGNMIKLLARDYADARIVGICDGTATIEDPSGLDLHQLCLLVDEDKPLAAYNTSTLGSTGGFWLANTEDGLERRNTMPFRVESDVFVPGGGRPASVNAANWRQYLTDDGRSSSPLVVEGANLFFTPAARQSLFDAAGTTFIKDSSANKCGVVTSSYEILLSMMFDTDQFLSLKHELVSDVIDRFRQMARNEARLLYRESAAQPGVSLPKISADISEQITRLHDAIEQKLRKMNEDEIAAHDHFQDVLLDHLPTAAHPHAALLFDRVPLQYRLAAVSANLASNIVYAEGTSFVNSIGDEQLADIALRYRKHQRRISTISEDLRSVDNSGQITVDADMAAELTRLLQHGGVRSAMELDR